MAGIFEGIEVVMGIGITGADGVVVVGDEVEFA